METEEQLIEYAKEQEEHLAIERGDEPKDIKDLKDADVYFVVDRDAKPSEQQKTLIRLGSKLNKALEYNYNIMIKEASVHKMYALVGMASLYGYSVKVQQAYDNGSVPRGLYVVAEAGDDLTEVACTLNGLPSIGSIGCS